MQYFQLTFTLNGITISRSVPLNARLYDVLHDEFGLPAPEASCGVGHCGGCTVLLDGVPVNACLVPAFQVEERRVETYHLTASPGSSGRKERHSCAPGVALTARWLLKQPEILRRIPIGRFLDAQTCSSLGYDALLEGAEMAFDAVND